MIRRDKINYYLDLADIVSQRGTCLRKRYGAVIVKNKRILTTGYNGAPAGIKTCVERGECLRKKQGIASGTMQELCYAIPVSYTHLRAHETVLELVCRLLLEKKKTL